MIQRVPKKLPSLPTFCTTDGPENKEKVIPHSAQMAIGLTILTRDHSHAAAKRAAARTVNRTDARSTERVDVRSEGRPSGWTGEWIDRKVARTVGRTDGKSGKQTSTTSGRTQNNKINFRQTANMKV